MTTPEEVTAVVQQRQGCVPTVKAVRVEQYLYLSVVDPDTNELNDFLFSSSQMEVAKRRAAKRHSILPFISAISPWKAWILRLLGFHFI
jgi:hypothetical protein